MNLSQAIRLNQRAVLDLTEPDLTRILPILREVRRETARALAGFLKSASPDDTYTMHAHRTLIIQLDRTMREVQRELPSATLGELTTESRIAGLESIARMKTMIEAGEKRFVGVTRDLRLPTARILANVDHSQLTRHQASAAKYGRDVVARIHRDLAIGAVRGESVERTARRLLGGDYNVAARRGATAVADGIANRQLIQNIAGATRIVRTELNGAYARTEIESLQQINRDDPGWLKMWDATHDMRTCGECAALDGKTAPLDGLFPGGYDAPPIHPNDRCTIVPWHPRWDEQPSDILGEARNNEGE